jgi:uncharacterized membrane protein
LDRVRFRITFRVALNWIHWSLLAAWFAGITGIPAKAGVSGVNPNLATAIRSMSSVVR